MDESALRKLIDCLNKQSDDLHGRDHFWTTCLIVGCAFEVIFVCHEYLEGRNDWYKARTRGFLSFPEKPPIKWLILEILGVILVLAGIGGELRVSILAGRLETRLREANGSLVLLLEGRANNAEAAAKGAAVAAGTAKDLADAAGRRAATAQEKARAAEGSAALIGGLEKKLSDDEIRLRTETGEVALILAAKASGREFLPNLFESLKNFPPAKAEVRYNSSGEPTTRIFAENLCSSLEGLGWTVSRVPRNFLTAGTKGTIVVNKWESRDSVLEGARRRIGKLEANISMWSPHIEVSNGISSTLASRLVTLGMSLDAQLIKEPTVDSNSFLIIIGDVEPAKGK